MKDDIQTLIDEGIVDPDNKAFTVLTGAVVEGDYVLFLETADAYAAVSDEMELTFVTMWSGSQLGGQWHRSPKEWQGASCCVWRSHPGTRLYVSASKDGHVYMFGPGGRQIIEETIPGVGRSMPWSDGYSIVTRIREIGSSLFVTAADRKVFRRDPESGWRLVSADIVADPRDPTTGRVDMAAIRSFEGIAGSSEHDLYACGLGGAVRRSG